MESTTRKCAYSPQLLQASGNFHGGYYFRGIMQIPVPVSGATIILHQMTLPRFRFSQHLNFIIMGISEMETFTPAPLNPIPETTRLTPVMTTISTAVTTDAPTLRPLTRRR